MEGVEHGYVGLDCDDANSAFGDTVCLLVSLRGTLEPISKGLCDLKEGFRAIVALRIESDEAVNIVVLILPGRVEGKENRDFGDKFRSGSVFSIDRVDTPCGEIRRHRRGRLDGICWRPLRCSQRWWSPSGAKPS
jgi:hypothetical protein